MLSGPCDANNVGTPGVARLPLRDLEHSLIRQAVQQARGNVAEAARTLGISRATVYRKLGMRQPPAADKS